MAVSVVVVNYQTPADLAGFCQSYEDHAPDDAELIIVNVEPTDDDIDVAEQFKFTQHIVAQVNVGYGSACNRAAKQTFREVIALFNADTRLRDGTITECAEALLGHREWGILGPRQVDEHGLLTHAGIIGDRAHPRHRAWKEPDRGQYTDVVEVPTVSGSAYFVKREVWNQLTWCPIFRQIAPDAEGAFLPTKHFYEETWCSYHAIEHGWKVVYYGPVTMEHHWHKASPVGYVEQWMPASQAFFRHACDKHHIPHD